MCQSPHWQLPLSLQVLFMGVCLEPPCLVTEFCSRGSLHDVLQKVMLSAERTCSSRDLYHSHLHGLLLTPLGIARCAASCAVVYDRIMYLCVA